MTPEEFKNEMEHLVKRHIVEEYNFDKEQLHICMDDLMCNLLRELGYSEGIAIFENTPKWYA